MYPGMPAPRTRPTVVTVSSYLLYASAAASLIGSLVSLSTIGTFSDVYGDLYENTAESGFESIIVGTLVAGVAISILVAAGLVILAIFNNRGRQGARITTWVIGGLYLCCSGFGLLGTAAGSGLNMGTGTSTSGPSAEEVESRLSSELPGWYEPVSTLLTVLTVLALLAAVILLLLPASNAYFRKPQAGWDPMMPYPGQPYPGQPYPGQPYPGQSPYPSYPGPQQQPYPGPYPGQQPPSYPGQGYPGPSGEPQTPPPGSGAGPQTPPPGSVPPVSGPGYERSGPVDPAPHTGSLPPTDPWSAPSPPPQAPDDPNRRPPTDPA